MGVFSLLLRIGLIIFTIEALIMTGLAYIPPIGSYVIEAAIDAILLTVLSVAPLLYFVILPYVRAKKEIENAAESARHKIERRLSQVLTAVVDGIITTDDRGKVQIFNPSAENIFGYDAEEVLGQSINILMPKTEAKNHDKYYENYDENSMAKVVGFNREVVGRHKDGSEFPVDLAVSQVEIDGERMFTGIVRDITLRKKTEQALIEAKDEAERASRIKSEFTANMSHELRTPLNAIIGFSEVVSSEMFGPIGHDKYAEYIGDIQDSAQHLLELINDILDMARIEAEKLELNDEAFDLLEVSKTPTSCVKGVGVVVHNNIPSNLPLLYADRRRVKQILLNLLSNAVKFTPEGGRVDVDAFVDDKNCLVLSVSDTGIGMNEEEVICALRPFEQIDTGLNRKYEGTGLGLPLVERMARLNGGVLEIESGSGKGTRVCIRFSAERTISRNQPAEPISQKSTHTA